MRKNAVWIVIFAVIAAICAVFALFYKRPGDTAQILRNGEVIETIALTGIEEPYEFTVEGWSGGTNTVRVENGRIAIIDADCPDKVCVDTGYISDGSRTIVCMPHRISVRIVGADGDIDAAAG